MKDIYIKLHISRFVILSCNSAVSQIFFFLWKMEGALMNKQLVFITASFYNYRTQVLNYMFENDPSK